MKTLILLIALVAPVQTLFAGFTVPRHVFKLSEIEQAAAQAKENGKALAIVYTDNDSH